jgi:hypothetical protein
MLTCPPSSCVNWALPRQRGSLRCRRRTISIVCASLKPDVNRQSSPEPTTSLTNTTSTASSARRQSSAVNDPVRSNCCHSAQASVDSRAASEKPKATASASVGAAGPPQSSSPARRTALSSWSRSTETGSLAVTPPSFQPPRERRQPAQADVLAAPGNHPRLTNPRQQRARLLTDSPRLSGARAVNTRARTR